MSKKRICVRLQRKSFDERICDDLCEVILQYLSLEDKLKLECVSKQFQRTIFVRHFELRLHVNHWKEMYIENRLIKTKKELDLKSLESLLKKCPNIKTIKFLYLFCPDHHNYNQFIRLICKYCHNLVNFKCPLKEMSDNAFQIFQSHFVTQLKNFCGITNDEELDRLKYFPKTEKLSLKPLYKFEERNSLDPNIYSNVLDSNFKELKILKVHFNNYIPGLRLISKFQTLRRLEMIFHRFDDQYINDVLNDISRLKELKHLSILRKWGFSGSIFSDLLKQIPYICYNLKNFECNFRVNLEDVPKLSEILAPLKRYKSLKKLKLLIVMDGVHNTLSDSDDSSMDPEDLYPRQAIQKYVDEVFTFEAFDGLSNITHFELFFEGFPNVTEKLLKDIHIYLPELQFLKLWSDFDIKRNKTTETANILSRLTRLRTIELNFKHNLLVGDQLKPKIAQKCRKIRNIVLKFN